MSRTLGKVCLLSLMVVLFTWMVACGDNSGSSGQTLTMTKLVITPTTISLPNGTTQQLTATATYSDGTSRNVTAQVAWAVSPNTVAKVNASGMLTSTTQ